MEKLDLIERYLQFIRFWLPKQQREEIVAELSDDLYTQVEERESELGHSLSENEVAEFLKRRGSPMRVAAGFSPAQHLIGPVLFPFYLFVLKLGLFYLAAWISVWLGMIVFSPDFRVHHLGMGILRDWVGLWQTAIFLFAVITIVFAVIERVAAHYPDEWDPKKLPKIKKQKKLSFRTQNLVELFFTSSFVVAWAAVGYYLPGFESRHSLPQLDFYYWTLFALMLVSMGQQITNVVRPQWTWLKPATQLATTVGGLVVCLLVQRLEPLYTARQGADAVALQAAAGINALVHLCIVVLGVSLVIACAVYGFQLWKAMKS